MKAQQAPARVARQSSPSGALQTASKIRKRRGAGKTAATNAKAAVVIRLEAALAKRFCLIVATKPRVETGGGRTFASLLRTKIACRAKLSPVIASAPPGPCGA